MKACEFCGASMAEDAGFCASCGRLPSRISQRTTRISSLSTFYTGELPGPNDANRTLPGMSSQHTALRSPSEALHPVTLVPMADEQPTQEVQEQRNAEVVFDATLPLLGDIADHPTLSQAPVISGTPHIAHVPVLPTTPQIAHVPVIPATPHIPPGTPFGPGMPIATINPPPLQYIQAPQPLPAPPVRPINLPRKPTGQPSSPLTGCLPLGAIFLATILIIILTSIGLSLTAFAPGLALSGNSTVAPGGTLSLHGHNFLPNGSVSLTLDNGLALPVAQKQPSWPTDSHLATTTLVLTTSLTLSAGNVLAVHGDGTFNATISISPAWALGPHTIYAIEALSHRRASLAFTIAQVSATATPTPTQQPTPTPTATPSPTPTATPVPPPFLSCITPARLALGPISELSSQVASAKVTLCTTGTGTLTWRASWDQNKAPWLQVAQKSGTVQAPDGVQTTISASAAKLNAGTYTASVTFTALESNSTQTLVVTLTVKGGCVDTNPQSLSFSGVAGTSDPASSQAISITNCGLASSWSATIENGSDWLSLSSSQGTLQSGASKTLTVTASNLNAGLKAGTYEDTITVTIGSDTSTIKVTLVVQDAPAPPTIAVSPGALQAGSAPCTSDEGGNSTCTITLTNQSSTSTLTWTVSTDGNGVNVAADSTTIPAAGTEQVTISIPNSNCGTALTITFKAPGNSASVTWNCTPQTPIH